MGEKITFGLVRLIGLYLNAYSIAMLVLIIIYFFVRERWKKELINWLYVCNSIVPWITLAYLLIYIAELFVAWYGQNQYEWYAFSENRASVWSPYGWSYWLLISCNCLLPLLLWFKRLRKSRWFTFIMILILNAGLWYEKLVIYIT